MASIAVAAMIAMTLQTPSAAQPVGRDIEAGFANPGAEARPWLRWWWPGADVEPAEIDRELGLMRDNGFGGAEVQPFNPGILGISPEASARMHRYATPPFFDLMKHATRAAAARGLALDYTFGSAWPTGGGFAITPELALRELTMARTEIESGAKGPLKVELPARSRKMGAFNSLDPRSRDPRIVAIKQEFDAIGRVVAVVAIKGTAPELKPAPKGGFAVFPWRDVAATGELDPKSPVVLTDRLKADGTLDWTPPPGRWQVFVFKEYAANTGLFAGVGEGPQLVADHFDQRAFAAHAARAGDPLAAALGPHPDGLRGTFVDSLELMPDIYWSRDFLAEFRKRRGYDLTPYLPLVLQPGWMQAWNEHYSPPYFEAGGIGERIRADYRLTVSDLLADRFIQPFVDWNRRNGLLARFQAHGAPVDTLKGYGLADIPETEDLVDGGNPYFMRLARSAAHLYGRALVSAESLCWAGRPYGVTLGEMRQRADLIFASGVNQMVFHGMPYAYQRERWPGWHAFAPIAFSTGFSTLLAETNPLWPGLRRLTAYVARMQALMRQGTSVVPVALYLNEIGYYDGIEGRGEKHNPIERALLSGGYDYDRINAQSLLAAHVADGQLVTAGGAKFPALVLPPIDALRAEVAERIADFARAGLPVFFLDHTPARELGFLDYRARDARIAAAMGQVMANGGQIVRRAELGDRLYAAKIPANLRFAGNGADIIFVQRAIDGRTVTFLHNNAQERRDASFDIAAKGRLTRWDAMTGKTALHAFTASANGMRVPLSLAPGESALLVVDPAGTPEQPSQHKTVGEQALPASGWSLHVNGHGVGGVPIVRKVTLPALTDFANVEGLSRFSGTATYRTSFRVDPAWRKVGTRVILDLGEVHDMATVSVNDRALPILIGPDWTVDISGAIRRSGKNQIEIIVANVPNNAMIDPKKPSFKDIKPVPAGLIGPVTLRAVR
jgi:hypothetical protein